MRGKEGDVFSHLHNQRKMEFEAEQGHSGKPERVLWEEILVSGMSKSDKME